MLDFLMISTRSGKRGVIEIYPKFIIKISKDLMIRGGGLIVLGASAGNGVRRVFFPAGVENLTCLTGQKILKRGSGFVDVDLKYGECAVFRYGKGK